MGFAAWMIAAEVLASAPKLAATRTPTPPLIDGKLDDAVWQKAPKVSTFTQKFPAESKAPSDPTTMRVLYDDVALYVAFECTQKHAPIVDRLTRRDRVVEADRVSVSIGSRADGKTAYEFTVSASGSLVDAVRYDDTEISTDWDENWEARTARTEDGWTAEIAIPLRILRFDEKSPRSWDFQARRYVSELQEVDEWAFIPRSAAGEVSRYGRLEGLDGIVPGAPLELRPFVFLRGRRQDAGSTGLASGNDFSASLGLDLKWHPTRALVLDATFHPDFGQVEADEVVLNLTTYEQFYPEKRPFFLEGIDLFATPRQLLYTRRIGGAPPAPALRDGEQLVDLPNAATIYGASKLTGALDDKWQVATLQAVTARNDVEVQQADGTRIKRLVDPLTAYQAFRLRRELPGNGYIGAMATATTHAEPTAAYPASSQERGGEVLCSSGTVTRAGGRCFADAYVGSVDWRFRPGDDWVTGGQLIATTLRDGPPRALRDGNVIRSGDVGTGAYAFIKKDGGAHWLGELELEYEGRKLDYTDLGFNRRSNDYKWFATIDYRDLEKRGPLLETHTRVEGFGYQNIDGLRIALGAQTSYEAKLSNFWKVWTELHWRPWYFDDREVGDGTALERAERVGAELELSTDPTRRVSLKGWSMVQKIADHAFLERGEASVLFRVLPQFDLEIAPTWLTTYGEQRYATTAATGEGVFGRQNAKSIGTVLRATYTFTPRLTLQAYGQLFLASGHYDDFKSANLAGNGPRPALRLGDLRPFTGALPANPDFQEGVLNTSVVLRWEYSLGSTLFLVYTRSQSPTVTLQSGEEGRLSFGSVRRAPAADAIMAKLTYWWAST